MINFDIQELHLHLNVVEDPDGDHQAHILCDSYDDDVLDAPLGMTLHDQIVTVSFRHHLISVNVDITIHSKGSTQVVSVSILDGEVLLEEVSDILRSYNE